MNSVGSKGEEERAGPKFYDESHPLPWGEGGPRGRMGGGGTLMSGLKLSPS